MKILLASILPVQDSHSWSGICKSIYIQLSKRHQLSICYSESVHSHQKILARISYYMNRLIRKRLNIYFSQYIAKRYARVLEKQIILTQPDLLIVLGSGSELYAYKPSCTAYLIADATFSLLQDNYTNYTNLFESSAATAKKVERQSLKNFNSVFYTSKWAQNNALKTYPKMKTTTINFGSNLGDSNFVVTPISRDVTKLRLLIVGKDFYRKGISQAVKLQNYLDCHLDIIGIDHILDKNKPSDLQKLKQLYSDAHFLILFPTADCTPIVINEANSVGTPAIVYPVGGIPDMIEHGVNGYIVNDLLEARTRIEQAIADPDMYLTLRRTTFQYYTENLSWDIFEQKLITK